MSGRIIIGDCLDPATWASIPDGSVHCCVTSPPYWALRDYGTEGQLGLEKTPEEYVEKMVAVFKHVWRVLRDDATVWLNMGDTYVGGKAKVWDPESDTRPDIGWSNAQRRPSYRRDKRPREDDPHKSAPGMKPKDLVGIPWLLAFALRADGWYLRQEIIWEKPNPMPESTRDRCTKAHESIFLLTKKSRYFYDQEAIKERSIDPESHRGWSPRQEQAIVSADPIHSATRGFHNLTPGTVYPTRNKRSVWTVATHAWKGAHFATFPPKLITPCILAGTSEKGVCPECGAPWERVVERGDDGTRQPGSERAVAMGHSDSGPTAVSRAGEARSSRTTGWRPTCECFGMMDGRLTDPRTGQPAGTTPVLAKSVCLPPVPATVLDPFFGAGTTGLVAHRHGRDWLGIELNPEYARQAQDRIDQDANPETWTNADVPDDATLFQEAGR